MKFETESIKDLRKLIVEANTFGARGYVRLTLSGDTLQIRAKSQNSGSVNSIVVDGQEDGSAEVSADRLSTVAGGLPDGIKTVFSVKDDSLCIRQKGISFKLKIRDKDDETAAKGPEDKTEVPTDDEWTPLPEGFQDAVARVYYASSSDETKPALRGIRLDHVDGVLNIVASDGRRLSIVSVDDNGTGSVTVPVGFLSQVVKKEVEAVAILKNSIWFKAGAGFYFSTLITNQFPAYSRVIPSSSDMKSLKFKRQDMEDAVKRMSLTTDINRRLLIDVHENRLDLHSGNEAGSGKESIVCDGGKDFNLAFHIRYIMDILKCTKAEFITMSYPESKSPVVFSDDRCPNWKAVVMPMIRG